MATGATTIWHDRDWWYKHDSAWVGKHHPHWQPWHDFDDLPHGHGHGHDVD
jgi:hypothetical protein